MFSKQDPQNSNSEEMLSITEDMSTYTLTQPLRAIAAVSFLWCRVLRRVFT
jgi:hypothetical protein